MSTRRASIEVIIDELVLHGFAPSDRDEVARALQSELATSLEGWRPGGGRVVDRVDGGSFSVAATVTPAAIGREVARRVGQVLAGGPADPRRDATAGWPTSAGGPRPSAPSADRKKGAP